MIKSRLRSGFSLIELLVSAAILGVLLTALSAFFVSQQKLTTEQVSKATLNNDARLALLRVGDIVTQASYIYPTERTITITSNDGVAGVPIGQQALAVLIPRALNDTDDTALSPSAYCNADNNPAEGTYCGFLFSIEPAAGYINELGETIANRGGLVLVERRVPGVVWKRGEIQDGTWNGEVDRSPLAHSVKVTRINTDDETEEITSLGEAEQLGLAKFKSQFDKEDTFLIGSGGITDPNDTGKNKDAIEYLNQVGSKGAIPANALITSVNLKLVLETSTRGKRLTTARSSTFFTRSVPREALPN